MQLVTAVVVVAFGSQRQTRHDEPVAFVESLSLRQNARLPKMLAPFRPFPVSIRFGREVRARVLRSSGKNQTGDQEMKREACRVPKGRRSPPAAAGNSASDTLPSALGNHYV